MSPLRTTTITFAALVLAASIGAQTQPGQPAQPSQPRVPPRPGDISPTRPIPNQQQPQQPVLPGQQAIDGSGRLFALESAEANRLNQFAQRLARLEQSMQQTNEQLLRELGEARSVSDPQQRSDRVAQVVQRMLLEQRTLLGYLAETRNALTGLVNLGDDTLPATPANPATPATPAVPGAPGTPATPATPGQPANPANPDDPNQPATPPDVQPGQPNQPAQPNRPQQPDSPRRPNIPPR